MASVVKEWGTGASSFVADANWAFSAGGGTGLTSSSDADAINIFRNGKSLTNGAPFWEWSGSWETLGVPAGGTITAVVLDYYWSCLIFTTGTTSQRGPAELRDSASTLRGTFSVSGTYAALTGETLASGSAITGLTDASTTSVKLRLNGIPKTGSSSSAQVSLSFGSGGTAGHTVKVTITYTPASTVTSPRPKIILQAVQRAASW